MFGVISSIFAAIIGGVICHYIIKWIDERNSDK